MPRKSKTPMEAIPEVEPTLETHSTTDLNREYDEFVANELRKDMEARAHFKLDDEPAPKKKRTYKKKAVSPEPEKVEGNVFSPYSPPINATFYLGETEPLAPEPKNPEVEYQLRRMIDELAKANRTLSKIINIITAVSTKI